MGSAALRDAIQGIIDWGETVGGVSGGLPKATEAFGSLTFNDEAQKARLPKTAYAALRQTIVQGQRCRHYTHRRQHTAHDCLPLHAAAFYTPGPETADLSSLSCTRCTFSVALGRNRAAASAFQRIFLVQCRGNCA